MRVSGRGKSESLLFLAPAGLFGIFFVWLYGGPQDVAFTVDQFLLKVMHVVVNGCSVAIQAASKMFA
jgi:hypothetical protein